MSDLWIICCVVFAAVILAVHALYWLISSAQRRGATLKRRLALSAGRAASEPVDILRQERGLANFDHPRLASLNEFLALCSRSVSGQPRLGRRSLWRCRRSSPLRGRRPGRLLDPWLSSFTYRSFAEGGSIASPPSCRTR